MNETIKIEDLYYDENIIVTEDPELSMIYIKQDIMNLFDITDLDKELYLEELQQFINTLKI